MKTLQKHLAIFTLLVGVVVLAGCGQTMHAIKHAKLQTNVNMSNTIFLDAETLVKNRNIFLRVTNTSQLKDIAFEDELRKLLAQKGYNLTKDPSKAGYIIQANVLYMDYERNDLTADGMLSGGFGGAIGGALLGGDDAGKTVGAIIGATVGSLAGAAVGAVIHVDKFVGVVDVQIKERVKGGVVGEMTTQASQGAATTLKTTRKVKSDFQTYRTRIVATAVQTNIDKKEASQVLSGILANQIGGIF